MTWTAPEIELTPQLHLGDEREVLSSMLGRGRSILLWKCAGLNGTQLATGSVAPSSLSLLGLLRHMTEVERGWFRMCAAGEPLDYVYCSETNWSGDFDDGRAEDAEADYARYLTELTLCDKAVADIPLDRVVPHPRAADRTQSVRWIYLHMIEEYGRHAGHADLLRERIDGATGYQAPGDNRS
ncbi:DUF664 domain-containing protein [Nocardia sp. 2]|uniref:DUF664 domain-containing protein n=1 Tax=Nocardia acididurans TaxID=2802282 RepID=A0ABS1MFI2_9NOCA|nr:DinB family protein [Nocardia acididurans]MBL1078474.1 DUF664 domain-containing protein [Nocardia acididurans]